MDSVEWKKAEAFRKTEIYGRAAKYFRTIWDNEKLSAAGWRYAHCLRKTGYSDLSMGLLSELMKSHPEEVEVRDEFVWAIYESRLSHAKEQGKTSEVIAAAKEMLAAGAEGVPLKLAVFAVISAAKTKGQWNQVSCWCDLLDPDALSDLSRGNAKQTIPSDRERWYFGKLKALVKQEEWHHAEAVSRTACAQFPDNLFFRRWRAHALAGLGQVEEAVKLLETLRPNTPWYTLADLARYSLELEQVERSWELAVEAARAPGQLSAKVNLWELMAKILLALDRPQDALYHLALALRIRHDSDWPQRPHHRGLIAEVLTRAEEKELPKQPSGALLKICKESWTGARTFHPGAKVTTEAGGLAPGTGEGRVMGWDGQRPFAFIEPNDGSDQIFVLTKDLPDAAQQNRARVAYRTILQYDKRKNRQSLRAVDITCP